MSGPAGQPGLAFITGASSGIGQALAARYGTLGWRLALVGRREAEMQAWARAQGWGPERCQVYAADVAVADSIIEAGQRCLARQGLPDRVIAAAGISIGMDSAVRADLEVMRETLAVNLLGTAATFHPFLSAMQARGSGTLVGVASVAAIRGLPGHGAYCASKAGVVAYCESLRGDCRAHGVHVMTLVPGYVATPLTAGNAYAMPFMLSAEEFARRALRAIESGASYSVIPWQMAAVSRLMRMLPNGVFDRLAAGRGRKKRRGE